MPFNSLSGIPQTERGRGPSYYFTFNSLSGILIKEKSLIRGKEITFNSLSGIPGGSPTDPSGGPRLSTPFPGFLRGVAASTLPIHDPFNSLSGILKLDLLMYSCKECLSTPFPGFDI